VTQIKRFRVVMVIERTNRHHVEGVLEDIGASMYKIEEEVRS
jgi:16S rRNA C1402 N4-methylase RsmH